MEAAIFAKINLSKVYCNLDVCDSALLLVNKGIEEARENNYLYLECEAESSKSSILKNLGYYKESLLSMNRYIMLNDSLEQIRNVNKISGMIQQQNIKLLEEEMNYKYLEQKLIA